jgi:hypothetical protein
MKQMKNRESPGAYFFERSFDRNAAVVKLDAIRASHATCEMLQDRVARGAIRKRVVGRLTQMGTALRKSFLFGGEDGNSPLSRS